MRISAKVQIAVGDYFIDGSDQRAAVGSGPVRKCFGRCGCFYDSGWLPLNSAAPAKVVQKMSRKNSGSGFVEMNVIFAVQR